MLTSNWMRIWFVGLLLTRYSFATDYYVSVNGNDNATGSIGAPWKSVATSLGKIAVDQGHVLHMGEGVFEENKILVVPSGVSLVGAGSTKTILKVNAPFDFTNFGSTCNGAPDASYDNYDEKFVMQVNGSNLLIKGFKLDGLQKTLHGGIFAGSVTKAIFEDLWVENFKFAGIWIHTSNQSEVRYSVLRNNGWYNNAMDTGNLQFYDNVGLKIHHNTIEETDPVRGPYGIKAYAKKWSNFCWWQWWTDNWNTYADGMEITDNVIRVPELAGWTTGGNNVPGIVIEFNGISMKNVLIARNTVNNVMSLVGSYNNNGTDFFSARVLNNHFDLGRQYRYAVEANIPGLEFAYNLVDGGLYPISQWETNRTLQNLSIHHNVFRDQQNAQPLLNFLGSVQGFKFMHNTVDDLRGINKLFNGPGFNGVMQNNYLDGISVGTFTGTQDHNSTTNPGWNGTGALPAPFYQLTSGSSLINAGVVISGINNGYASSAPDIGAFESGVSPWSVGPLSSSSSTSSSSSVMPISAGKVEAESYVAMSGIVNKGTVIGQLDVGAWARYQSIDFSSQPTNVRIRYAVDPAYAGQKLELRSDSLTGSILASFTLASTGSWTSFATLTATLASVQGVHQVLLVPKGSSQNTTGACDLDWFEFYKDSPTGLTSGGSPPSGIKKPLGSFNLLGRHK